MRFRQDFSSSLTLGAFLIVATLMLAQTTPGTGNRRNAGRGHSSLSDQQPQSGQPAIAVDHAGGNGVRRMAGGNPGSGASGATGQRYKDSEDMTTRYRPGNNKTTANTIAVDHAGGNGVRRMAGGQNAGTSKDPSPSSETQKRKHIAGVKYQDRTSGGGNNARGLAVNEQGSTKQGSTSARVRRRR